MIRWRSVCRKIKLHLIFILVQVITDTQAYSGGAGQQACSTMVPWHGGTPKTTPAPFEITVSQNTYQPMQQVRIDIKACGDFKFKGFLIQARLVQYYNQDIKVGVFGLYNNAPYQYTCPDSRTGTKGQALTHTSNSTKTNVALVWQAPRVPQGHVIVRVTVVESFSSYWVGAHSPIIWDTSSNVRFTQQQINSVTTNISPLCKATTTANTTTSTSTTTTTPTPSTTTTLTTTSTTTPATTTSTTTTSTTTTPSTTTSTTTTTPKPTTTSTTSTTTTTPTTTSTTTTRPTPSTTTTTLAPPQMSTTLENKEEVQETTRIMPKATTDWLMGFIDDQDIVKTTRTTTLDNGFKTSDTSLPPSSTVTSTAKNSKFGTTRRSETSTTSTRRPATTKMIPTAISTTKINKVLTTTSTMKPTTQRKTTSTVRTTTTTQTKTTMIPTTASTTTNNKFSTTTTSKTSTTSTIRPTTASSTILTTLLTSVPKTLASTTMTGTSESRSQTTTTASGASTSKLGISDGVDAMGTLSVTSTLSGIKTVKTASSTAEYQQESTTLTKTTTTNLKSTTPLKIVKETSTSTVNPTSTKAKSTSTSKLIIPTTVPLGPTTLSTAKTNLETTEATNLLKEQMTTPLIKQTSTTLKEETTSSLRKQTTTSLKELTAPLREQTTIVKKQTTTPLNKQMTTTLRKETSKVQRPNIEIDQIVNQIESTTVSELLSARVSQKHVPATARTSSMKNVVLGDSSVFGKMLLHDGGSESDVPYVVNSVGMSNIISTIKPETTSRSQSDINKMSRLSITPLPPTSTSLPQTPTPLPTTSTSLPPTSTSLPPTPTPLPTTSTPLPSTHTPTPLPTTSTPLPSTHTPTPLPTTAIPLPPTSTSLPPTPTPLPTTSTSLPSTHTSTPLPTTSTPLPSTHTPTPLPTTAVPLPPTPTPLTPTSTSLPPTPIPLSTTSTPLPSTHTPTPLPTTVIPLPPTPTPLTPTSTSLPPTPIPLSTISTPLPSTHTPTPLPTTAIPLPPTPTPLTPTSTSLPPTPIPLSTTSTPLPSTHTPTPLPTTAIPLPPTPTPLTPTSTSLPPTPIPLSTISTPLPSTHTPTPLPTTAIPLPPTHTPTPLPTTSTSLPSTHTSTPLPTTAIPLPSTHTPTPLPTTSTSLPSTHTSTPLPTTAIPLPSTHTPTPLPTTAIPSPPTHTPTPLPTTAIPSPPTSTPLPTTSTPLPIAAILLPPTHTPTPLPTTATLLPTTSTPLPTTPTPLPITAIPLPITATPLPTIPTSLTKTESPMATSKFIQSETAMISPTLTYVQKTAIKQKPAMKQKFTKLSLLIPTLVPHDTKTTPTPAVIAYQPNKSPLSVVMKAMHRGPSKATNGKNEKTLGPSFPYNPQCNKTQGCFHDCRGQTCTFLISWVDRGAEMDFEMKAVVPGIGDKWIAVGFSYDQHMGSDSVSECVTNGGFVNVYQSYNLDTHANARLRDPKFGISNEGGSLVDGIFTCRFTRQKVVPAESRLFDLNKDWYILFAHGTAMAAMKLPHSYSPKPAVSSRMIDLQAYLVNVPTTSTTTTTITSTTTTTPSTTTSTTTTTATPTTSTTTQTPVIPPWNTGPVITQKSTTTTTTSTSSTTTTLDTTTKEPQILTIIEKDSGCGVVKGCYEKCRGDTCSFIVSWNDRGEFIDFEIKAQLPNDGNDHWVAVGFSRDENMGNDNVIECVSQSGMIDAYQSYNKATRTNERLSEPKVGLSNVEGSYMNGIFVCKFTRQKMIDGDEKAFDLNNDYYMMVATGRAYGGDKEPHSILRLPSVSNQLIDLQSHMDVTTHAKYYLIKLHGCLMIIAWIFFASIGIIVARFYRQMWPEHFWCKERIWYQVHRACMIATFGCVVAGFILAFLDIQGYSKLMQDIYRKIDGETFHQAHPVMGIVVTLLTVVNPIVAMCRPLPGTTKRTVFDWLHRILGMSSHLLAVITIFAGIELSKASAPDFMKYVLMAYVGYQVLITIVLEIHKIFVNRKEDKRNQTYLYEMHRKPYYTRQNNNSIDIEPPYSGTKKAILGSHILIISATTLILVILLLIY